MDVKKLKELVAAGPPLEPSAENPGPLMQAMVQAEAALKKEKGADPTPEDLIGALITILDYNRWHAEMEGYNKLKALADSFEQSRLLVPDGVIPPRLVK